MPLQPFDEAVHVRTAMGLAGQFGGIEGNGVLPALARWIRYWRQTPAPVLPSGCKQWPELSNPASMDDVTFGEIDRDRVKAHWLKYRRR